MYHKKIKLKNALSAFGIVLVELVLVAATTAAFVAVFNRADARLSTTSAAESSRTAAVVEPSASSSESSIEQPVQQTDDWRLVLVNFDNIMPDSFEHTIVHQFNVDIDSRIVSPYKEMHDAAEKENIHIWISSGYRNSEKQQKLYNSEIEAFSRTGLSYDDAVSKASKSVARPGYSEHNTGLAIDVNGVLDNFDETKAFKWMQQHAKEYGFVLRYPKDKQEITKIKYEPWHYRYVGVANAIKMDELDQCLEEYIDYLKKNQTASN